MRLDQSLLPLEHKRKSKRGLQGAASGGLPRKNGREKAATCALELSNRAMASSPFPLLFWRLALSGAFEFTRDCASRPGRSVLASELEQKWWSRGGAGRADSQSSRGSRRGDSIIDYQKQGKKTRQRRTHREARLGRDRGVNSHRRSLVREKRDGLADSDDEKKNKKWRAREKERTRSNSRSVAKLSGVLWRGAPHRLGSGGGGGGAFFFFCSDLDVANQSAWPINQLSFLKHVRRQRAPADDLPPPRPHWPQGEFPERQK